MASEFRRRTLLTWGVFGAGFYGLKHAVGGAGSEDDELLLKRGSLWHGQPVNAFAVSADGSQVATGSRPLSDRLTDDAEGVVCWRVSDGLPRWKRRIEGGVVTQSGGYNALSFSPDGALLGVLTRQNLVVSIEVPGSAPVGRQALSATERAPGFFYSQDGMQLFLPVTWNPGFIGKVVPSRSNVSAGEWMVKLDNRDAVPFRLDQRGLHVVDGHRYRIVPGEGAPIEVADLMQGEVSKVVVTPSRRYAAALSLLHELATIDAESGRVALTSLSPFTDMVLGRSSGHPLGLERAHPAWHAYGDPAQNAPSFSGRDAVEAAIAGALPVAPSPDGNRAVSVDADGEVSLWEASSRRQQASLGRFEHASAVAFPTESRVVVFGPRLLAFIDLATKKPIARYRFPGW